MHIDSVRELKSQAQSYIDALLDDRVFRQKLGVRSSRRRRPHHPRNIALGISAAEGGEYRLAIRVQHPLLLGGEQIEEISKMARGEVDVKYIGRVHKLQGEPWYQTLCRPIRIGCCIAHRNVTVGTLGAIVQSTAQVPMVLSNNHVLANENKAKTGDPVLQPAPSDGGEDPDDRIATFSACVPLKFPGPNILDCAVATVQQGITFDPVNIDQIGALAGLRSQTLAKGDPVSKLGQTSGKTSGAVSAVDLGNLVIGYDSGDAVFNGQIEIESSNTIPFSQLGDSGSLIVDADLNAAGLLFSENDQGQSYANPMAAVLSALSVNLIT
jgi:hypothetical protein